MRAVLTDMNTPLGRTAGNWLEVKESVECLENKGPADLRELVIDFAAHLLVQTKQSRDLEDAREKAADCLRSGEPRRKWDEMLLAQGTDLDAFHHKLAQHATASVILELKAEHAGFVSRCDARMVGEIVRDLGGGRLHKDSVINFGVGVDQIAKPGEKIQSGGILGRIHAADQPAGETARMRLKNAFTTSDHPPTLSPLIVEII